jgi:serine O-acetyltransferase
MPTNNSNLSALTNAIVDSYNANPKTRHIDAGHLPSRDAVIELLTLIRELVFPGYFGKQNLTAKTLEAHVSALVSTITDKLMEQVTNAIRHQAKRRGEDCPDCDATAQAIVDEFMGTIPALRATLATDVQAAFDGDPAAGDTDEIIFSYPGLFAISVYRIAHELHKNSVPLIPRIMTEYAHGTTGIDIHPGAAIGPFFFIDHGTGVVIGETTTIGAHVKLYQGVTLGALSTRDVSNLRGRKRHPTLEDNVTVAPGASILGGETVIGKGATITSNAFVTQSVPPGARVSVKSPELQIRNHRPTEFKQDLPPDFQI